MVIGIGGVCNAGKSTLARNLKSTFNHARVVSLCQDDYAFPTSILPKIHGHADWEIPQSIDFTRYREEALRHIGTVPFVILEGIFAFHDPELNALMDLKLFLTLKKETFLERKNKDIRWGKEPAWYVEHIWNSHLEYCHKHPVEQAIILPADHGIDAMALAQKHICPKLVLKNT